MGKSNQLWREIARQSLAEFLGTMVLVIFIIGGSAQVTLSGGKYGSPLSSAFGTGIGVMMAVKMTWKASGAHINPVMSFGLACVGKFSWTKLPFYVVAQYCGAFVGSAIVYFIYIGALYNYDGNDHDMVTALTWTSFPKDFLSIENAIFDAAVGAALLMITNLGVADQKNMKVGQSYAPIIYGLIVTTLACSYSFNAANPINPARDLGPRVFLAIAGWGDKVFYGPNYSWWWVPLVAPHIGVFVGAILYELLVEIHHPPDSEHVPQVQQNIMMNGVPNKIENQLHNDYGSMGIHNAEFEDDITVKEQTEMSEIALEEIKH